jgi:hypothetical protein
MPMLKAQKDLFTRYTQVYGAWERMRPKKQFYGLSLGGFGEAAKTFLDARAEIARLEEQLAHANSKHEQAVTSFTEVLQGVVSAVKGDPTEGQNGELYGAMGYVPKNMRSTGLTRQRKAASPEGGATT